ncbi:MAG: type II toxin-antitoxin system Phd/YefM family antitoxin [Chloroflexota bacterium]|jgi:prevent-host-death family protein
MHISIAEVHNRLSSVLKDIQKGPIPITRRGKAVGVIISPEEYENLSQVRAYIQMIALSQQLGRVPTPKNFTGHHAKNWTTNDNHLYQQQLLPCGIGSWMR